MSNVTNHLVDCQFIDDTQRFLICRDCLRDAFKKNETKNRSLVARSLKSELRNPSWISVLKDKILAS